MKVSHWRLSLARWLPLMMEVEAGHETNVRHILNI